MWLGHPSGRRIIAMRMWNPFVRISHLIVPAGFTAYLTEEWRSVHRRVGYMLLAMVVLRIV